MALKVYYRISDKGNPKEKLPHAGKADCLRDAMREFGAENLHVIADNCTPATIALLRESGLEFEETSLGNAGSFIHMVEAIVRRHPGGDAVYLLEDDYLHLPGSRQVLEEGLTIGDYVTLYDHPDKYLLEADGGNPFNAGALRPTRLYATAHSHWRETDSTTMTFACRVSTLAEDLPVWRRRTRSRNPDDFHAFMELTRGSLRELLSFAVRRRKRPVKILLKSFLAPRPRRRLVSAVPARATHAEVRWLAPVVDWTRR